jgi:putative addiction module killer protein
VEAKKRAAVYYRDLKGREPAREWLDKLKDRHGQAKIFARIARVQTGNFGDHKSVGEGVYEIRIDVGPGYRIYYAIDENDEIILLLVAGDKSTQSRDISDAKKCWKTHKGI